jgi:tight adherence protein C
VFETTIAVLTVGMVLCMVLAIGSWIMERRQRYDAEAVTGDHPVEASLLLGAMTPGLASQFPLMPSRESAIAQEIREAGFYHRSALMEYQAVRTVLILLPLVVGGVLTALAPRDQIPLYALMTAIGAGLGASLPRYYINARAKHRARQIERGLPITLDLVNLGLSAGQTIFAALNTVVGKIAKPFPVLAKEMKIVVEQAELSNLPLALAHFADRTNVPDVRNLAMVLAQTDRLGTDISGGLLEYSNNLRTNMRHRAEAQANRANFWMLIPTVCCLWVAAALMLVMPVYYDFMKRREEIRGTFSIEQQKLNEYQAGRAKKDADVIRLLEANK